jgi:hypothetical protein
MRRKIQKASKIKSTTSIIITRKIYKRGVFRNKKKTKSSLKNMKMKKSYSKRYPN